MPIIPPGECPQFDLSGNIVDFGPCPPNYTPNGPPTTSTTKLAVVRRRATSSGQMYYSYDKGHPQGVPITAAPLAGPAIRYQAFGSSVTIDTTPIADVTGDKGTGANVWFKVSGGGYINAANLQGGTY